VPGAPDSNGARAIRYACAYVGDTIASRVPRSPHKASVQTGRNSYVEVARSRVNVGVRESSQVFWTCPEPLVLSGKGALIPNASPGKSVCTTGESNGGRQGWGLVS